MASEGKDVRDILAFYFPGTDVRISPGIDGWQETRTGSLILHTTHPLLPERKAALDRMWTEAEKRFPPRGTIIPEIIFAPTTEMFRQLTAQPGWTLASTRGNTIVLQPEAVLHVHGRNASATVLHEMLHVLVEADSSGRAPLWLREGLVEVLTGEPTGSAKTMSASATDLTLMHAGSFQASERAHLAAAARVRALLVRYGLSTVRGWLSSGVPAGVA